MVTDKDHLKRVKELQESRKQKGQDEEREYRRIESGQTMRTLNCLSVSTSSRVEGGFLLSHSRVIPLIPYPLCQRPLLIYFLIQNNDIMVSCSFCSIASPNKDSQERFLSR